MYVSNELVTTIDLLISSGEGNRRGSGYVCIDQGCLIRWLTLVDGPPSGLKDGLMVGGGPVYEWQMEVGQWNDVGEALSWITARSLPNTAVVLKLVGSTNEYHQCTTTGEKTLSNEGRR